MKVVTKLAIALLLYNAVCLRLIDRERERGEREYQKYIQLVYFVYGTFSLRNYYWCAVRENIYIWNHSTVYQFILHFSWLCHGCFETEMGQGENHLSPTVPKKCTDGVIICLL